MVVGPRTPAIVQSPLPVRRALLFVAAAVLSAVLSDWLIEGAANVGLYGRLYADHDQSSMLCTATAGLVFLVAAGLTTVLERFRVLRPDRVQRDWLIEAARDISSRWSWHALAPTFAVALLVRYAMESAELLQRDGHVGTGLGWLGGPVLIALAVHLVLCAVALFGLLVAMRALDRTVQSLLAMVVAFIAALIAPTTRTCFVNRDRYRAFQRISCLASNLSERGPPTRCSS